MRISSSCLAAAPAGAAVLVAHLAVIGACGGGTPRQTVTMAPPPMPMTRATLAGPLCEATACTCRDEAEPGDAAGEPDAGRKRLELRLGPAANPLWVMVDDMVLYKSEQQATACFYIDLTPGPHRVSLRAQGGSSLSAALLVREFGVDTKSWYETFRFGCGSPGACSHDELADERKRYAGVARGLHDPCGSIKVKNIGWDAGRAPDQQHPTELQVEATLDLYKFSPQHRSGAAACDQSAEPEPAE